MKKRFCTTVVLFSCVFINASCGVIADNQTPRPSTIEEKAVWAGGADGGSWIYCEEAQNSTNTFRCNVYDEGGSCLISTSYSLRAVTIKGKVSDPDYEVTYHNLDHRLTASDLTMIGFNYFDGHNIGLMNYMVLIPINEK